MADSTRDMRRSVYERELKPKFSNQKLVEITQLMLVLVDVSVKGVDAGTRSLLLSGAEHVPAVQRVLGLDLREPHDGVEKAFVMAGILLCRVECGNANRRARL